MDTVRAQLMDRQWECIEVHLQACSTSGTKKPVWVYPRCLQLCCFFTLLAKSCPNTHSRLTSSTWGEKNAIFFHCKSCPRYQGRRAEQQKLEAGMDQWRRQEGGSGSREREKILRGWVADMAHEFNWGQKRLMGWHHRPLQHFWRQVTLDSSSIFY